MEAPTVAAATAATSYPPGATPVPGAAQAHLPQLHHQPHPSPHQQMVPPGQQVPPGYNMPSGQMPPHPDAEQQAHQQQVGGQGLGYYSHFPYGSHQMPPYMAQSNNYYSYSPGGEYDMHHQQQQHHHPQNQFAQQQVWHPRRPSVDGQQEQLPPAVGPGYSPNSMQPNYRGNAAYPRRAGDAVKVDQRLPPPLQAQPGQPPVHSHHMRTSSQPSAGAPGSAARARTGDATKDDEEYSRSPKSPRSPMSPKNRAHKKFQCPVCKKHFRRDLPRHMRTHAEVARFVCPYPRDDCTHKRGQFNRPYDFKKHLLHAHFWFDNAKMVRGFRDLKSKLDYPGACSCGVRFVARDWLNLHILGGNLCPILANANLRKENKAMY